MKRMLIILTLTTLTMSFSFAQFTKETKSAGGTLGWASTTYDGDPFATTLTIAPSVGYFVIDNVVDSNGTKGALVLDFKTYFENTFVIDYQELTTK